VTVVTALIELLVGMACVAFSRPCWRRGGLGFRVLAGCLVVAGTIAIVNAIVGLI
jgi:hypothetical protein